MDNEVSVLELAKAVATYLEEELERNPAEFIPVHREVAIIAVGLAQAVADDLERQASGLHRA